MKRKLLGIIGGSRLAHLSDMNVREQRVIRTPYGSPSGPVMIGYFSEHEVVFLPRHGYRHALPAHKINYRANIWALHSLGVSEVVSIAAVGGMSDLPPGSIAIPDQIIDYTWGREHTYFEGLSPVTHTDFTCPFDEVLRQRLLLAAEVTGIAVKAGGVYACTQGPRLESAAEIQRLVRDGADMVGMTGMPEAALAKEIGLPYAAVILSIHYAAGINDSCLAVNHDQELSALHDGIPKICQILSHWAARQ